MTYLTAIWSAIRAVPTWVWLVAALAISGGVWLDQYGDRRYDEGYAKRDDEQAVIDARNAANAAALVEKSDVVTTKVVTEYVDKVRIVREKAKEIVRNVYITVPADACPIHGAFRLRHDEAVRMSADAAPWRLPGYAGAPVEVAAAAATVVDNYGRCHENAATLIGWQKWYREQAALR
jgi:hypothetical protein